MKNKIWVIFIFVIFMLTGCSNSNSNTPINDIDGVSFEGNYDYSLFSFIPPLGEEGYVLKTDNSLNKVNKQIITDLHLAPSDLFLFDDKYYFASGAYSNSSDILSYDLSNNTFEIINTQQPEFIDKLHVNSDNIYLTTLLNKDGRNKLYDVKNQKTLLSDKDYFIEHITTLDDYIISVSINNDGEVNKVKKYTKDFELINEITIHGNINRFSCTIDNKYLYLFNNYEYGKVLRIDLDLNITEFEMDIFKDLNIEYGNLTIGQGNKVIIEVKSSNSSGYISGMLQIDFEDYTPEFTIIDSNIDEKIINIDPNSNEFFTRQYKNNKTVINIRDLTNYQLKYELILKNDDPIFFVDSYKKNDMK